MAVRIFTDSAGTQWTTWAVRPQWERRRGADRRSGRDRRTHALALPWHGIRRAEQRRAAERRGTSERRLTPGARAAILPGLEHGWLCFEGDGMRRRLVPIPPDWETCDTSALEEYHRQATPTRLGGRAGRGG